MRIEEAGFEDLEEILTLQKRAYQSEAAIYDDYSLPPLVQTLNSIQNDFTGQVFLKAVIDREIIGSVRAYAQEDTCYIGRLIVHPAHQNKGLGAQLLQCIESRFQNCRRFELFTGKNSAKNLYLYNKAGYKVFREEQEQGRPPLVYMEKIQREETARE